MLEREGLGAISRAGSQCIMEGEELKVIGFEIVVRVADQTKAQKRVHEFMLELGAPDGMTVEPIEEDVALVVD